MKKVLICSACIILILLQGCGGEKRFLTHKLRIADITRNDAPVHSWLFADLKGEGAQFYISAESINAKFHAVLVKDLDGRIISQINVPHKVRGLKVLNDPRNGSCWLFYSFNDQHRVTVAAVNYIWQVPLQRQEKVFEGIGRTDRHQDNPDLEWYANIQPELLADIDGDGSLELVCRALDAFTVNPRGLVVYDFESGRIKWRLDLPTSLASVLLDDFDGDGNPELICSNYAFKNSREEILGMDDANGWLLVISPQGELLHRRRSFDGYGEIFLQAWDHDQDCINEIYAVNITWGAQKINNSVEVLRWNGNMFRVKKRWTTPSTFEKLYSPALFNTRDATGSRIILVIDRLRGLVMLDDTLEPVAEHKQEFIQKVWAVGDLNHNQVNEILAQTAEDDFLILDDKLAVRARLKNPFRDQTNISAHIVDTGHGRDRLIAICSPTQVHYYHYQPEPVPVLLYRWLDANALLISIFLFFTILALLIHTLRRQRLFILAVNSMEQGILVLSNTRRIVFYNQYVKSLLTEPGDGKSQLPLRDLRESFPDIYNALIGIKREKTNFHSTRQLLPHTRIEHQVNLFKLHGLRKRYLITIVPLLQPESVLGEKIAWADIARRLSHNVRRHITNIILMLGNLQEGEQQNLALQEYIALMRGEIEKIRVFTHAFQRFSELRDYDLKQQDLLPSVEHCLSHLQIPDTVKVIKNWQLSSVAAFFEPIRFEEALANVLTNSLEAMPEGGTLHITVKKFSLPNGSRDSLSVLVEVEDTGSGIPFKYLEEIWKPFFTNKKDGTGIGLPESKKIIESMGGRIEIQSEEGVGTVVSIWLKGSVDE